MMNDGGTFYSTSAKRALIDPRAFASSSSLDGRAKCDECFFAYGSTTMQTERHPSSRTFGDVGAGADDDDDVFSYSSKLSKMSLDERSTGLHDVHGVADLKEETLEMLQSKVTKMNQALASPPGDSRAYKAAVSKSPEYVEHLKIPCLRAKEYNGEQAAALMIRLFNRKLELFGKSKLAEEIHLKDLTEEENGAVQKGLLHFLRERDRAGRAVLFMSGKLNAEYGTKTVVCTTIRVLNDTWLFFVSFVLTLFLLLSYFMSLTSFHLKFIRPTSSYIIRCALCSKGHWLR
jgi:hypothetical protein